MCKPSFFFKYLFSGLVLTEDCSFLHVTKGLAFQSLFGDGCLGWGLGKISPVKKVWFSN